MKASLMTHPHYNIIKIFYDIFKALPSKNVLNAAVMALP